VNGNDEEYVKYSISENGYIVNFELDPRNTGTNQPDFISFVAKYVDMLNLLDALNTNEGSFS